MLGVGLRYSRDTLLHAAGGWRMTYPILHGLRSAPEGYVAWYVPSNYLIDKRGSIVAHFIGDRYWMGKDKQELVKLLLAEKTEIGTRDRSGE